MTKQEVVILVCTALIALGFLSWAIELTASHNWPSHHRQFISNSR